MLMDIMFRYKTYNGQPLFLNQKCIEVRDGEIKRIKAQLVPHKVNSNLTYSTYILHVYCPCAHALLHVLIIMLYSQVTSNLCTCMYFHPVSMLGFSMTCSVKY